MILIINKVILNNFFPLINIITEYFFDIFFLLLFYTYYFKHLKFFFFNFEIIFFLIKIRNKN